MALTSPSCPENVAAHCSSPWQPCLPGSTEAMALAHELPASWGLRLSSPKGLCVLHGTEDSSFHTAPACWQRKAWPSLAWRMGSCTLPAEDIAVALDVTRGL